ncbi:CAAX prenyl protease 2 [Thecamonas trahens ATCC 50062]|uniref:intramembrane prenyl-peptidase Rce1 n=1 Tax=Thecamonas trahens ATCC 50062 TaxID=461836 RepID=A0A0L0DRG8_THETB|nr:CAAX prenyl protease 2 [Thecamonas trahens ATCC 50062]KNC54586.1 CAAX prenyl protease 2 [Thecamonas trahens ATCC 50062]|eukprot:XP_013761495.1 CAAX prenyl protease 2 [Thecamonas trahens ATCC 50062]
MIHSLLYCVTTTLAFVGSLYLWPNPQQLSRDEPAIIKRRLVSIVVVSVAATGWLWLGFLPHATLGQLLVHVGLLPPYSAWGWLVSLALPLAASMACFAGPLVMAYVDEELPGQRRSYLAALEPWVAMRNVVIAPLGEEYVFRALLMTALRAEGFSWGTASLISPLCFGLAHLHLYFAGRPLVALLVMLCYTSIFGGYSGLLFAATRSFWPPVAVHAFCNYMGLPEFAAMPGHRAKVAILVALFTGVAIFALTFDHVTSAASYGHQP